MALLLPNAVYFHVPRTGGNTVRTLVAKLGLAQAELRCECHMSNHLTLSTCCIHNTINMVNQDIVRNKFTFAFVRNPLTFYQSYWCLRTYHRDWNLDHKFDALFYAETFSGFLQNILKEEPGYITGIYQKCFPKNNPLDFIGKFEILNTDLITALQLSQKDFSLPFPKVIPVQNIGAKIPKMLNKCLYTHELHAAICEADKESLERFGYSPEDIPSYDEKYIQEMDQQAVSIMGN